MAGKPCHGGWFAGCAELGTPEPILLVGEEETRVGLTIFEGTAKGKEGNGIVCGTLTWDEYDGPGPAGAPLLKPVVSIGPSPCFPPAAGFTSSRQRCPMSRLMQRWHGLPSSHTIWDRRQYRHACETFFLFFFAGASSPVIPFPSDAVVFAVLSSLSSLVGA